jgi:hypothetical protein
MTMETYFHCASLPLGPGSVICPGNWGRMLRLYRTTEIGTFAAAFRERVLEDIRQADFPSKPSGLASCFVLFSEDDAKKFRDQFQRTSIIYEVEPVSEPSTTHEGDYSLIGAPLGAVYFDPYKQAARDYWSTLATKNRELLLPVPIRVLRCVDDSAPDLPGLRDKTNGDVHGDS